MTATAAEQFNRNYIRLPKNAKLNGLAFGLQQVIGEIFSFTGKDKSGKQLSCFRTWKKFQERCCVSRATVGRALKIGREKDLIKGNNKKGYVSLIEAEDGEFWRLPQWVCKEEFIIGKTTKRKLKKSERKLYAFLYTRCTNKRNGKHIHEASIAEIAEEIGLSERTVQRASRVLIWAGLIYQPKEDKGLNAYKTSRYTLNYKLVLLKEKEERAIRKEAEKAMAREKAEAQKAEDKLFDEFNSAAFDSKTEVGEEEFILHNKDEKKGKKSRGSKKKRHVAIPEMKLYEDGTYEFGIPNYTFSKASDEELKNIYRLYTPVYKYLGIMGQSFISLVGIELDYRAGKSPPGEGYKIVGVGELNNKI